MPPRTYGSWLLGRAEEPLRTSVRRARWLTSLALVLANMSGAVGAFALAAFVLPTDELSDHHDLLVINLVAASIYVGVSAPLNTLWGLSTSRRRIRWAFEDRSPTTREQRATLRIPLVLARNSLVSWMVAAALFGTYNSLRSLSLGVSIIAAIGLGAILSAGNGFFLSEFALRPVAARALASGPPGRLGLPGLRTRALVAWGLGSAVPVCLLVALSIEDLSGASVPRERFSLTVLCISGVVLVFGWFLVRIASRATADPIRGVRAALAEVERGNLDVEVTIYDASDAGLLQAGFNRMVAGLRERERIRQLFGAQVGEQAAGLALAQGLGLEGEVREVAVVFVDLVGSTTMAATRPPTEVVRLLNRLFEVVIEVAGRHEGWVNKFQGDATLVVFGAPGDHRDAAGAALTTAREVVAELAERLPGCAVGVGVAAGAAVAGHVGAAQRYEYTVVGDCVNEAARLSGVAKDLPGRIAASAVTVERACGATAGWAEGEPVVLRGRLEPTRLMVPTT